MPELTDTDDEQLTRIYEICVLYGATITQKEESQLQKDIEGLFDEIGAKQISKDEWGRRGLAIRIKGFDEGKYIVYYVEADPEKMKEVDTQMRITPNLLRHIIVKPPKGYQIEKYSEKFTEWLQNRETEAERKEKQKEEDLKRKVVERAKRKVKRVEEEKKEAHSAKASRTEEDTVKAAAKADEKELDEQLEKLISDDLDL
jgi:ribosomal protein S6